MTKTNIFRATVDKNLSRNRTTEYNIIKKTQPNISQHQAYDIIEGPTFCGCGSIAKFVSLKLGYSKYCSEKCYDLENGYKLDEIISKIKNGWSPNSRNFIKIFNLHSLNTQQLYDIAFGQYKCKHCGKIPNFVNFKVGYLEYCSVSCSNHYKDFSRTEEKNKIIQEKRKKTTQEKYGVDINLKLLSNCGINNIMHSENNTDVSIQAKTKRKKTLLLKYNREFTNYASYIKNRQHLNENTIRKLFVKDDRLDLSSAMDYFNCSRTYFNKFDLPKSINNGEEWIHSIVGGKRNDRTLIKPLEIDILNIEHKIGVEFDGLAYHSSGISTSSIFNNPNRKCKHLEKTEMCEKNGIQLFHIFENEYLDMNKRKIWESVLKSKMNKSKNTIYARKCSIKEITHTISDLFCVENHLQGKCNGSIKLGLFYNDELISVMVLGKSRFTQKYEYELLRFCSKLNYNIPGAFSKLLKYFERKYNPTSLVSYANRRWSHGNVYTVNNFTHSHDTQSNYFYFKPHQNVLLSREQFQKHKLKDKLDTFNPELTETQNMYNNGYRKIYDCGNKVYVKIY